MKILYADTETYSTVPIKNGHYRYAEDVEVMLFAYAFDDGDVHVVDFTEGEVLPKKVQDALTDPEYMKVFHNSQFDRTVIREGLGIVIPAEQIHDTMVQALAHAMPGSLDKLCGVLGVPLEQAKSHTGKNLIQLFCKPTPKNWKIRRATKETHPVEWKQFVDYAGSDITAMRVIHKKMPSWNYRFYPPGQKPQNAGERERALWLLDQRINDRGFTVDVALAEKAVVAIKKRQRILARKTGDITHGDVEKATQRDKLLFHICEYYGVELPDLRKSTVEKRLNDPDLPEAVRELLAIRLAAATTSTGKYNALLRCVNEDDQLRGTLQFNGASRTRRWAGRLFQPQNLPRPTHDQDDIDFAIEAIKLDSLDLFEPEDIMGLCSSAVRGSIIAPPGKLLCVSDLSNIEGRKAAWFANEDWKLDAFRSFDAGDGEDLYKRAYGKAFGVDPSTVDKEDRQIGKVMELMLGYGGGVGAFLTGALTYGIDLNDLANRAWPRTPDRIQQEAQDFYFWQKKQRRSMFGLEPEVFMAMDGLKRLWREAHPNISALWKELEEAARGAIKNPGSVYPARRVKFVKKGAWLRCILPSGAALCYPSARVDDKGNISYRGVNQYTRKWGWIKTYGGKLLENICQSSARDVMAYRMIPAEEAGYEILLTVHDELITQAPDDGAHDVDGLSEILATQPEWCQDLPLAAGGFDGYRYRKD